MPFFLPRLPRFVRLCCAPALVIALVCGFFAARTPVPPSNDYDQKFYYGMAHDLVHDGRFTDGFMFATPGPDGRDPPGMRFAPIFPGLIALLAQIDPSLVATMDCVTATHGQDKTCPRPGPLLRMVQVVELSAVYGMIFWLGLYFGGEACAWAALMLALVTVPSLIGNAFYAMTEMTCLFFTTLATGCAVRSVSHPRHARLAALAAGMALAAAALTRPAIYYGIFACILGALPFAFRARRGFGQIAGFAAGAAIILLPWLLRNDLVLGRFDLSFGYSSHTLVQRISFDAMTGTEYTHAYVCFLPDGNAMGRTLWGAGACDRFGWEDRPDTFYMIGIHQLLDSTLAASGGYAHHLSYLLRQYILPHPFWHLAVSIPLAIRGTTIAHWWGLVLSVLVLIYSARALRQGDRRYLILSLPALFLLALNASVAVNQPRYNFMLIPADALAGSFLLTDLRRKRLGNTT